MAATELIGKLVTYADYKVLDVDDNYLYELLDGELVQKAAPSPPAPDCAQRTQRHCERSR